MNHQERTISSRRTFLKRLGAGAIAAALPATAFPAPSALIGDKMPIGLVTYLWGKDWPLPELIENCRKAKVLGVELRVEHAHDVHPGMSAAERADVRRQFADSPVHCLGMGTNQSYHYVEPAKLKESIEGTKAYIKLSHDIGGSGVKVKPNAFPEGVSKEATLEQIGRSLREVGIYAQNYGQQIRLEVHGQGTQELPNIRRIMEVADHPNVRVCWNCNNEDLIGEGLTHNFNLVKEYLGDTVHIRQVNVGEYPYQQLVNLLVEANYTGWILLECRTDPADKVKAMIEQRKLWRKMEKKARRQ